MTFVTGLPGGRPAADPGSRLNLTRPPPPDRLSDGDGSRADDDGGGGGGDGGGGGGGAIFTWPSLPLAAADSVRGPRVSGGRRAAARTAGCGDGFLLLSQHGFCVTRQRGGRWRYLSPPPPRPVAGLAGRPSLPVCLVTVVSAVAAGQLGSPRAGLSRQVC